ncbi:TonB-dependent receptor plug domain-containing protein [Pelobacter propionicus]|uniref:TonB-dependent receptor, plug n=1 Tax=Pelobacter propionicus (strain DSM 2379 / NBRC 103807 / OttBd1) TaxID=338966 RepID=A0R7L6_PELPD|nr:TonB-dependent receptor plug domain-containing protein [Pelobacter propionicus]ABL01226.1 TonB-dependent receptor, plug [Pelobacter propionicus DSM 2379]
MRVSLLSASLFLSWIITKTALGAQELSTQSDSQKLEDLLSMEISVASARPSIPSEAPAVVSVITREEIEQSGARDLVDVLRTIPGFDFAVDIWGVVGLGFRGLWGHEGKIKLTVDGMGFNEIMYGNIPFSNHFPVENIERIEIIRGPGSSKYGNFAELAVINIVTQIGSETPGLKVTSTTGLYDAGFARENVAARYGKEIGSDGYFGVSLYGGMAQQSANTYHDPLGNSWDMKDNSDLKTQNAELVFHKGDFYAGFIYDHHKITYRDDYGYVIPENAHVSFTTYNGQLSYKSRITDNLSITPNFSLSVQQPWRKTDVRVEHPSYYDPTAYQYRLGLNVDWDINSNVSTLIGGNYEWQKASYGGDESSRYYLFSGGEQDARFDRYSLYNEWSVKTTYVNLTAGLRAEKNTGYDFSYAPRVCLIKTFDDLSLKLIYNHAFRAPAIEQLTDSIKTGVKLKDETSDNYEIEASYRISNTQNITGNLFYVRMHNAIVYNYDDVREMDNYINAGPVGSIGAELQYRIVDFWGHMTLNYSYYRPTERSAHYYNIPNKDSMFLGFPSHKVTIDAGYKVTKNLNVNTTLIFNSARYGFDEIDRNTGTPVVNRHSPELVANLYLLYKNAFCKGFDIGFGIYDIFATNHSYSQPYNGGHAALPGPGREYVLRLSYIPPI